MSSEHAMNKHYGQMAKYRSSEGRVVKIKFKGPIQDTVLDYLEDYVQHVHTLMPTALSIFPNVHTFVRVNNQLNLIY